jgi:hypothetical protein
MSEENVEIVRGVRMSVTLRSETRRSLDERILVRFRRLPACSFPPGGASRNVLDCAGRSSRASFAWETSGAHGGSPMVANMAGGSGCRALRDR